MESLGLGQGGGVTDMKKPSILMDPSLDIHVFYLQVIWVTPPLWYKCLCFWKVRFFSQKEVPPSNSNWEVGFRGVRLISRPAHLAPLAGI